jgi:hypothetical protein
MLECRVPEGIRAFGRIESSSTILTSENKEAASQNKNAARTGFWFHCDLGRRAA